MNQDELLKTYPHVNYLSGAPLVKNAIVGEHRIVFNRDWSINMEGSHHFLFWNGFNTKEPASRGLTFKQRCDEIAEITKKKNVVELPDNTSYALCTHYWNGYPFGHWFETLAALRFIPNNEWTVLANRANNVVSTRDKELHLEIIGVPQERQHWFESWGPAPICQRLYCPGIDALVGHLSKDASDWLRMTYLNSPIVKSSLDDIPRKLYLSRNYFTHPKPEWTRRVINEESEVWPYLESKGFTLLKGTEPLLELIKMFNSATHIVFPHGSMVCYGIFSTRSPKVIEFISEHRVRNDNVDLLVKNEIVKPDNYKMIVSKSDGPLTNNITINMDELRKEIE